MLLNIFLFVGVIYLTIQCYRDLKEILEDYNNNELEDYDNELEDYNNETFED